MPLMTAEVIRGPIPSGCVVVLAHAPSEATELAQHSKHLISKHLAKFWLLALPARDPRSPARAITPSL